MEFEIELKLEPHLLARAETLFSSLKLSLSSNLFFNLSTNFSWDLIYWLNFELGLNLEGMVKSQSAEKVRAFEFKLEFELQLEFPRLEIVPVSSGWVDQRDLPCAKISTPRKLGGKSIDQRNGVKR